MESEEQVGFILNPVPSKGKGPQQARERIVVPLEISCLQGRGISQDFPRI